MSNDSPLDSELLSHALRGGISGLLSRKKGSQTGKKTASEGHIGQIAPKQLLIRIGKGCMGPEPVLLPLTDLKLFGMDISYVAVGRGSGRPAHQPAALPVDPETETDQNPPVIFAFGKTDIFIRALLYIFAVQD